MHFQKNQKGFAHLEVIIITVVVLGLAGFLVYRFTAGTTRSEVATVPEASQSQPKPAENQTTPSEYGTLNLLDNAITVEAKKLWIVDESYCKDAPMAYRSCADGISLMPPEKLPTIYGGGTEFFKVHTTAYENKDNKSAQQWFEDVAMGGQAVETDKVSHERINGYDAYYFKQINESYEEIRYVFSEKGKALLVVARVIERSFDPEISGKVIDDSDFTQYIPDIERLAKSVKFN